MDCNDSVDDDCASVCAIPGSEQRPAGKEKRAKAKAVKIEPEEVVVERMDPPEHESVSTMFTAFDALLQKTKGMNNEVHELALSAVRSAAAAHDALLCSVAQQQDVMREEWSTIDAHHLRVVDRLRLLQRMGETSQAEQLQRAMVMARGVEEAMVSLHPHPLFARATSFRDDAMLRAARRIG